MPCEPLRAPVGIQGSEGLGEILEAAADQFDVVRPGEISGKSRPGLHVLQILREVLAAASATFPVLHLSKQSRLQVVVRPVHDVGDLSFGRGHRNDVTPEGVTMGIHMVEDAIDGLAHILCGPSFRTAVMKRSGEALHGSLDVVQFLYGALDGEVAGRW